MKDKEKIRAEVERRYNEKGRLGDDIRANVYKSILLFIDSMPEEPTNKDLEEEMDSYFDNMQVQDHENIFEETYKNIARHFANWQREQMMEKAFMVELAKPKHAGQAHLCGCFSCGNSGDMVKIIII